MTDVRQTLHRYRGLVTLGLFTAVTGALVTLRHEPPPVLCSVGDVRAWQAAVVPPALANTRVDAGRFPLGVGVAAAGDWESLGEAVAVHGRVFIRNSDRRAPDYYKLRQARQFYTSAFVYLPVEQPPRARIRLRPGQTFAALWQELGASHPQGALIAGYVRFQNLGTLAISRPAIRGQPLATHSVQYYTEPLETREQIWTYLVGLVASPSSGAEDPGLARALARRADGRPDLHARVLVLATPPPHVRAPLEPEQVITVGRVAGASRVGEGELAIWPAPRVGPCDAALLPAGG